MNMRSLVLLAYPALCGAAVPQWGRFEASFTSDRLYEYALHDVRVMVQFNSPSGATRNVEAFWDGERTWKVRFSPAETGRWTYRTASSDVLNSGLHEQSG